MLYLIALDKNDKKNQIVYNLETLNVKAQNIRFQRLSIKMLSQIVQKIALE